MDENDGVTRRGLLTAGAGVALATAMPLEGRAASPREAAAAMMADPAAAVSSGQMWEQFCDALKPLGQRVGAEHTHGDFLTQVEGIRCLSRLVALGLDRFLEYTDPRHPDFYELQTPTRKYLGDNPDQTYRVATVDGKGSYRARDSAAGAAGVEVGVYAGTFRSDGVGGARRLVASRWRSHHGNSHVGATGDTGETSLFDSLKRLVPSRAVVVFALHAPFTVIMGWFILGEHLEVFTLIGFGIITTGVIITILTAK